MIWVTEWLPVGQTPWQLKFFLIQKKFVKNNNIEDDPSIPSPLESCTHLQIYL